MLDREGKRAKDRDRRWQRVREFMRGRGLDVLVVVGSRSFLVRCAWLRKCKKMNRMVFEGINE